MIRFLPATLAPARRLAALLVVAILAADAGAAGEFPDHYYFYGGRHPATKRVRELEGKPHPDLAMHGWIGTPQTKESLKGKVFVVDFWATWCPPCMKALPKNRQLADKYRDRDVVFIGIHDANRGHDKMGRVYQAQQLNYPVGIDQARQSERAWRVGFWPTYAVVDRHGIVRAAGITPNNVEPVIKRILENETYEPADDIVTEGGTSVPGEWLEGSTGKRRRLAAMLEADAAPPLSVTSWMNTEPIDLADLKGKVVLLDFWATWCRPCLRAIPKTNTLLERFADDGLVVIGVCHPTGAERMRDTVEKHGISFPVCVDPERRTISAYGVDGFPDYYLIDRTGRVRIADVSNHSVTKAVEFLINESK